MIIELDRYNPYAAETEYFAECVRNNTEITRVTNDDVVNVLKLLKAIQDSLEQGTIVSLFK